MNSKKINLKSFISGIIIVFLLMVLSYVLTKVIPSGEYQRILNEDGNLIVDMTKPFQYCEGGISFGKWILSPFLVLTADGNVLIIAIIAFLFIIGGIFNALNSIGLMDYMIKYLVHKFGNKKYLLMGMMILFFMSMGSLIGSFEEVIPFVPIIVALAISLGWDKFTGLSMSLVAVGCGFAAGIMNPFSTGIAQRLAGLGMFSGAWLRIVAFILIYSLLFFTTYKHARKIEKESTFSQAKFVPEKNKTNALIGFASLLLVGIFFVILSAFIKTLQDYTLIIVALMFLIAGVVACIISKMKFKNFAKCFGEGMLSMIPAIVMILMASSIKYILSEAKILDTIMMYLIKALENVPSFTIILFIYLIALLFEFFIPSGSAKAFLLIPLIVPIAENFEISAQLCVVAYAFGDGFSNVLYPTNPGLLISLGVSELDYPTYFKHESKFQILNLILTSGILILGYFIGY